MDTQKFLDLQHKRDVALIEKHFPRKDMSAIYEKEDAISEIAAFYRALIDERCNKFVKDDVNFAINKWCYKERERILADRKRLTLIEKEI